MTTNPDKLRQYYENLSEEELARQHRLGPSAFTQAVWQLVDEIYRARSSSGHLALPGQVPLASTPCITPRSGMAAEDVGRARRVATEKRTYVSLRTVGIIALPIAGCPHSAVLLQNEGLGMMLVGPIVLLFIAFLIAFLLAFRLTIVGLFHGPNSLRRRLLLWYACPVVFGLQAARLDPLTGHGPLPSTTVLLFAVLGFAPLLAMIVMPAWWLHRHQGNFSTTGQQSSAA